MRLIVSVLCAALALRFVAAPQRSPVDPSTRLAVETVLADPGCKPLAPIDVSLATLDGDGPGLVRVRLEVAPRLDMEALDWHWELSPDVRMLDGLRDGVGAAARGVLSDAEVVLLVPNDGRRHRAELVVRGRLLSLRAQQAGVALQPDAVPLELVDPGDEPAHVPTVRSLTWGQLPEPGPIVMTTDAAAGMAVPVLVVPSTHVPATAAAREQR
jgi:hypothetical protein